MKNNENNNGYIIFSADGTKPNCTLAALKADDGVQIIAEGRKHDFLSMFGTLARTLVAECNIPEEILHSAVSAAVQSGKAWETITDLIARKHKVDTSEDNE